MPELRGHVPGSHNTHKVLLYALSTCIWCRKTRQLLEDEDIEFDFVYVDLVDADEREAAREHIRRFSDRTSFPATIFDDEDIIIGYKPDAIKERLGL
ncbi:MAG: glutaredoxin family protein [Anaerolineae bacterium]